MTDEKGTPPDTVEDHSVTGSIFTSLESMLSTSVLVGIKGMGLSFLLFLAYAAIGGLLVTLGHPLAPPSFLSLQADPVTYVSLVMISLFTVLSSGSMILYQFLTEMNDVRSFWVVILSYVGLGSGGAVLRFTLPQTIQLLSESVPV